MLPRVLPEIRVLRRVLPRVLRETGDDFGRKCNPKRKTIQRMHQTWASFCPTFKLESSYKTKTG